MSTDNLKLLLKDIRCFAGKKEFDIRPLTFLVGENSTGKSTVLSCFQALNDFDCSRSGNINFNKEPYQMGAFADIAKKTNTRVNNFELGFATTDYEHTLSLEERKNGFEPMIKKNIMKFKFRDGEIVIEYKAVKEPELESERSKRDINVQETGKNKFHLSIDPYLGFNYLIGHPYSRDRLLDQIDYLLSYRKKSTKIHERLLEYLKTHIEDDRYVDSSFFNPAHSLAPVRSKPERTYNPLNEATTPEGSEIPIVLLNLSAVNDEEWKQLKKHLENFGQTSGLFDAIGIRRLGRTGDPFQLQIKVRGGKRNLIDTGYGTSQILPILVRILTARRGNFLLQQPEVHLHPKAQAELSSLLINMTKSSKSFLIETHSDAMINRASIEIMQGKIAPKDVSLIYLEPAGNKVDVHNISFDAQANMIGHPASYRKFFLKESDELLGF